MITINGDNSNNVLTGGSQAETINGFGGFDTLSGGGGNDVLNGDSQNDSLDGGTGSDTLNGGTGSDTADYSKFTLGVSANLQTGLANDGTGGTDTFIAVENILGGSARDFLTGNEFGNMLIGNGGDDILDTREGNDSLFGGDGRDTLNGGSGNDFLFGFAGKDELSSGVGADRFFYGGNPQIETGIGSNADLIMDFQKGMDIIDVAAADANTAVFGNQAFTFIGVGSFNDEGQIRFQNPATGGTVIQFNTSGNSGAEFEIHLLNTVQLSSSDFAL